MPQYVCRAAVLMLLSLLQSKAFAAEPHVKEIPLPQGATDISYMKSRGDIRLAVPGDMKQAGANYGKQLLQEKWTKSAKDNLQKNFWVQTFAKDKRELVVRTENSGQRCDVRVTPKGFLWDEDFAPRPEEIPIPPDAAELKYDDFFSEIVFEHGNSVQQLAEFYATKLDAKTWTKASDDSLREDSAILRRTSGIATILIYIDLEDGTSKVKINTKGMSWDHIKLANAKAKQAATEAPTTTAANGAKVPKRPKRPARGIEKLDRLPTQASVTIDGKKIPLPEVIAYEHIYYGEWRTHVVATARPLKLAGLLKLLKANVPEEKWGEQWTLPSPNVVWILDEDDRPWSVHLIADKVPGSSTEVTGEGIVEAGRARGTAKLKPQKFFEHSYEAEISFDLALLDGQSEPAKQLANAPKLENGGKIILAGKTHSLPHVLSYEKRDGDRSVIHVLLTEKRVDPAKVLASLQKTGEVPLSVIGIQPQMDFTLDENDLLSFLFVYCDGVSINWSGKETLETSVQSEGDRVRGTVKTAKKEKVLGKPCEFQASFDTTILRAAAAKAAK